MLEWYLIAQSNMSYYRTVVDKTMNKTMNGAVHEEFVKLHVVSKDVQSIRTDRRLEDMLSEGFMSI